MQQDTGMSAEGISISDLEFCYPHGSSVLNNLSLDVAPGEIVALLGPSGCGKSTLLRAIAGLHSPTSGQIVFSGPSPGRPAGNLAYVFQDATLLPWRTVESNVSLPFELGKHRAHSNPSRGKDAAASRALAAAEATGVQENGLRLSVREVLRSVGLDESTLGKYPRELSGGMRMRTSIARALVTDPSILLLDEPFAALDDLLRTRMNELLLELWHRRKRTVVFVTHNIAEAVYLSHRIALLGKGRIFRVLDNPLDWPRIAEQRTSVEFAELYGVVSQGIAEASNS